MEILAQYPTVEDGAAKWDRQLQREGADRGTEKPVGVISGDCLDFVHLGGVGEDVGELSVNYGWGFSTPTV